MGTFLRCKNKMQFSNTNFTHINKMFTGIYAEVLSVMIYTENKPSAYYTQRLGRKLKLQSRIIQNYIYRFHYEVNVLAEI
jgi:hypothetical protein